MDTTLAPGESGGLPAEALGAVACAPGEDIRRAARRYAPDAVAGLELLGDELAHIMPRQRSRVSAPQGNGLPLSAPPGVEARGHDGTNASTGLPEGLGDDLEQIPGAQTDGLRGPVVQRRAAEGGGRPDADAVLAIAERGIAGSGTALPHRAAIQASFGRHDVSGIAAHVGGDAADASAALGAVAYATGHHVAFAGAPTLHTAAHEAAHVIQQRSGVFLDGGLGAAGDVHERHADAVADRVVAGGSAAGLLDAYGERSAAAPRTVQRMVTDLDAGEALVDDDGGILPAARDRFVAAYRGDLAASEAFLTEGEGHLVAANLGIRVDVYRDDQPAGFVRVENPGSGHCLIHALVQAEAGDRNVAVDGADANMIWAQRRAIAMAMADADIVALCAAAVTATLLGGGEVGLGPRMRTLLESPSLARVRGLRSAREIEKNEGGGPAKDKGLSSSNVGGGGPAAPPVQLGTGRLLPNHALLHTGGNHYVMMYRDPVAADASTPPAPPRSASPEAATGLRAPTSSPTRTVNAVDIEPAAVLPWHASALGGSFRVFDFRNPDDYSGNDPDFDAIRPRDTESTVVISVVDTGIAAKSQYLQGHLAEASVSSEPKDFHGTKVAGQAAYGSSQIKLIDVQAQEGQISSEDRSAVIAAGIEWAITTHDARIVTCSIDINWASADLQRLITKHPEVLFLMTAGNNDQEITSRDGRAGPAWDNTLFVGGVTLDGQPHPNRGHGPAVDAMVPSGSANDGDRALPVHVPEAVAAAEEMVGVAARLQKAEARLVADEARLEAARAAGRPEAQQRRFGNEVKASANEVNRLKNELEALGAKLSSTAGAIGSESGVSFGIPVVANIVAKMLLINPALTPAEIKQILTEVAVERRPGLEGLSSSGGMIHPVLAYQEAQRRR